MVEFKESGPTEKMVNKILMVVMDWLKDHIVEADGDYATHAKKHA
jgi:hemerythrin